MYINNLRSSSYNADGFCEFRYYIEYCLGIRGLTGASATRGTIVHKVLEIMALQQLAVQNNQKECLDEETGCKFSIDASYQEILKNVYPYLIKKETHIVWTDKDYKTCQGLVEKAITSCEARFNPRNQYIIIPETKFHIELKEHPWAYYNYPEIGIEGYLTLRGTIDLVVRNEFGLLETIDYKSGRPKWDWNKNCEYTYNDFNYNNLQLMLYYYALRKMNPKEDYIFTIYYIQSAEPITVMFDDDTLVKTELLLRKKFEKIKNSFKPKKIFPSFKCRFCSYSKTSLDKEQNVDYSLSQCNKLYEEVQKLGVNRVFANRATDPKFEKYSGGGRTGE